MSEPRCTRAEGVVWRLGPDRVLLRKVGAGDDGAADLLGGVARVWIALDEPRTVTELVTELGDSADDVSAAVRMLIAEGFARSAP